MSSYLKTEEELLLAQPKGHLRSVQTPFTCPLTCVPAGTTLITTVENAIGVWSLSLEIRQQGLQLKSKAKLTVGK